MKVIVCLVILALSTAGKITNLQEQDNTHPLRDKVLFRTSNDTITNMKHFQLTYNSTSKVSIMKEKAEFLWVNIRSRLFCKNNKTCSWKKKENDYKMKYSLPKTRKNMQMN
uniref:Lipocalin n=1 Tax=Cacopsylla melanoneura TaxID=428564 RepID=A0A8D9C382_9HEMI